MPVLHQRACREGCSGRGEASPSPCACARSTKLQQLLASGSTDQLVINRLAMVLAAMAARGGPQPALQLVTDALALAAAAQQQPQPQQRASSARCALAMLTEVCSEAAALETSRAAAVQAALLPSVPSVLVALQGVLAWAAPAQQGPVHREPRADVLRALPRSEAVAEPGRSQLGARRRASCAAVLCCFLQEPSAPFVRVRLCCVHAQRAPAPWPPRRCAACWPGARTPRAWARTPSPPAASLWATRRSSTRSSSCWRQRCAPPLLPTLLWFGFAVPCSGSKGRCAPAACTLTAGRGAERRGGRPAGGPAERGAARRPPPAGLRVLARRRRRRRRAPGRAAPRGGAARRARRGGGARRRALRHGAVRGLRRVCRRRHAALGRGTTTTPPAQRGAPSQQLTRCAPHLSARRPRRRLAAASASTSGTQQGNRPQAECTR